MISEHVGEDDAPVKVVVGIETERGPWVPALLAAGYLVYAINPVRVASYRERRLHLARRPLARRHATRTTGGATPIRSYTAAATGR